VLHPDESEGRDHVVGQFVYFGEGRGRREAELPGVGEVFPDGEFGVDNVVLGDEARGGGGFGDCGFFAVEVDFARYFSVESSSAEGVYCLVFCISWIRYLE